MARFTKPTAKTPAPIWTLPESGLPRFAPRDLSVLAYAQGFTLWHYKAPMLLLHDLTEPGFFDHAADMLAQGDMLMLSARDGGRVAFVARVSGVCAQVRLATLS